jgi:hypothetical protein
MATEKRTARSEVHDFFAEIKETYQNWRTRGSAQPASRTDTPHVDRSEPATPAVSEITFTPVALEAEDAGQVGHRIEGTNTPVPADIICPITRQTLTPASNMYQCRQCGIYYSTEGWEFLRQTAKGQCCGCRGVNTVLPVVRVR